MRPIPTMCLPLAFTLGLVTCKGGDDDDESGGGSTGSGTDTTDGSGTGDGGSDDSGGTGAGSGGTGDHGGDDGSGTGDTGTTDGTATGGETGTPGVLGECVDHCDKLEECFGLDPECVDDCMAYMEELNDYGPACDQAYLAVLVCEAGLTCDQLELEEGCEDEWSAFEAACGGQALFRHRERTQ